VPKAKTVKLASDIPRPKLSGVVGKSKEWASIVRMMKAGGKIEVRIPSDGFDGLKQPMRAFLAAMKRKYRKTYHVYAIKGVIYAVPRPK
jgi:hypothetical protein